MPRADRSDLRRPRVDVGHDPRRARRYPPLPELPGCCALLGLDITVRESDQRRAPGHLSRQGPPALRWALYEAAQAARRPSSPDRAYYQQLAERIGGNRACIAISRKLLKRSYHLLRALGDQGLEPVAT